MRRLALRWRLALALAGALALVIAALALVIYLRVSAELDSAIDHGLRDRASTLSTLAQAGDPARAGTQLRAELAAHGESFAQVLGADGRVVLNAAPGRHALLDAAEIASALRAPLLVDHPPRGGQAAPVRLYAVPVAFGGSRYVAVVGTSLRDRQHAITSLLTLLVISVPVALLVLSLVGYVVVSGALRPVERMRSQAAAISAEATGTRLPVPEGDDELARLGRTLNAMLDRLEGALDREREFSANASHELRTPLALLKTEVELALDRPRSAHELRTALVSVQEETEHLVALAEDLLVLSRQDRGKLPIRRDPTELAGLLALVRRRFEQRAASHGRVIRIGSAVPIVIAADSLRLEQALTNLVENALRHGDGPIELTLEPNSDTIELHVRDHGDGFPEPFLDKAFDRFTRADAIRPHGGSGLGLAIVRAIAEAHGGGAHARNLPDSGADVWISLPLAPASAPQQQRSAQPASTFIARS